MFAEASELTYTEGENLTEAQKTINDVILNANKNAAKYYVKKGDFSSAFDVVFHNPKLNQKNKLMEYVGDLIDKFGDGKEAISSMGKQLQEDFENGDSNIGNLIDSLNEVDFTVETTEKGFKQLAAQIIATNGAFDYSASTISTWNAQLNLANQERANFEEKIKNTESGTENFDSYVDSYKNFMELTGQGARLGDKRVAEYAERLLGTKEYLKLSGTGGFEAVKSEIEKLGGVFSSTESKGAGFLRKMKELSKDWRVDEEDGAKYLEKDGEVIAKIFGDGRHWEIDTEKHLSDVAEAFGMTNEEVIACIQAIGTWQTVTYETTDEVLAHLRGNGSSKTINSNGTKTEYVYKAQAILEWKEEGKSTQEISMLLTQLEEDGVIFIDIEVGENGEIENLDQLITYKGKKDFLGFSNKDIEENYDSNTDFYQTDNIDALTAAYAYADLSVKDFFEEFDFGNSVFIDSDGNLIQNRKILDSLIESYSNGTVDLDEFYSTIETNNGKQLVLNVADLRDSLLAAGISEENINNLLTQLNSGGNFINFGVKFDSKNMPDKEELMSSLKAVGLLDDNNKIDVEAVAKFAAAEGFSEDQVKEWIGSVDSIDIPLSVEGEDAVTAAIHEAYTTPLETVKVTAEEVATKLNDITTEVAQAAMKQLAEAMKPAKQNAEDIYNYVTQLPSSKVIEFKYKETGKPKKKFAVGKSDYDNYSGVALTGEEGPELRLGDGYAEVLGANGPQLTHVDKDDVIYPADQTKKILSKGPQNGTFPRFALGDDIDAWPGGNPGGGGGGGSGGGSKTTTSSSSSGAQKAAEKSKEAWDKFYKDLKHQREMDEINDAQYYAALEANYRNYLDTSEENLDTWNSIVEEIYKGNYSTLTKAWNDELSEWDHKIAMEQATEADKLEWMKNNNGKYLSDNAQQHKDYQKALEDIHKGEIDAQKNAFNEGKEALEHALAMDLIKEKEYYEKVDELAQKTLVGNQKEIIKERQKHDEDMHKYEIKRQQDAWSKRQADLQYELEMGKITQEQYWKDYAASYKEILVSNAKEVADERLDAERELQKGIKELEKQAFEERLSNWERFYNAGNVKQKEYLAGLTRVLNTEYIQWKSLSEDEKKEKEQALFDVSAGYEDMASNNASALEKMHDLVVKQIQSEKKAEMEAIDVKIKDLKAVADARKQAIDDIEKENDYLKEQRGLQKTAAQLEAELEMMKSDTSAAGMAKRRKLEAQLAAQKEKIAESEHKHSIEAQKDQIDKQTQMQTEALEAQKKAIEDYTNNEAKVSEDAWIKMNVAAQSSTNMSKFFDDLTNWAKKAGLDIQDEISTTVAGFETAMDESQNNFINSMTAYEEAGLGPREMLQSLADSGVDVSKVLTEMNEMGMDNEWSDDVKGLLATRLQAQGVTNEKVASAAQVSADDINLNEGMGQKTALDMAAQMEGVGLGWEDAQEALNKYMAAQGRDVQLSAKSWRDLALQLTDNNVSMADLSGAMHTYGKNTQEWLAATSKVDASVNAALILKAKYGEVQTSINSMKSAYGAYEMDMLASGQKVIPAVDSFTTRTTQIVENGALTIDQKLEALQTETEERWDNSTFGQITAEQQAAINTNLQTLKTEYGLTDQQIQAGWDAVNKGTITPEELAEASAKLLELGGKYNLSDQQIQAGWNAVTSGQLSTEQLQKVDDSLAILKEKYRVNDENIGLLWSQVTAGTLSPEQLQKAQEACDSLKGKFNTATTDINNIWGLIANGKLNATDFATLETNLSNLNTQFGTDSGTINAAIAAIGNGQISGEGVKDLNTLSQNLTTLKGDFDIKGPAMTGILQNIANGTLTEDQLKVFAQLSGKIGALPDDADEARDKVKKALEELGKTDIDTSNIDKSLNNIQTALNDTQEAAKDANDALNDVGTRQIVTSNMHANDRSRAALRAAAGLDEYTAEELALLDANGDGKVTAEDARIWQRTSAKLEKGGLEVVRGRKDLGTFLKGSYASGTSSVPSSGTYRIDEGMQDELIYDPSQNALLSYLNKKSIVFPADVSRTMKQLFFNPDLLSPSFSAPGAPSMEASINNTTCGDIRMGDIVINGNTDQKTIAQIRAEQKRQARYIGDIFERDQRFMTNI